MSKIFIKVYKGHFQIYNTHGNILGRFISNYFLPEPFVPLSVSELEEITQELKRRVEENKNETHNNTSG